MKGQNADPIANFISTVAFVGSMVLFLTLPLESIGRNGELSVPGGLVAGPHALQVKYWALINQQP